MPNKIKEVKTTGYKRFKVCDATKCFSKKPLTLTMAKKQKMAIDISQHKKHK